MAKRKQTKRRPFNPEAVAVYSDPVLRPRMGPGETLWRYTITIPLEEITPRKRQIVTTADLRNLEKMFVKHFCGFTSYPESFGQGLRDPENPRVEPEMNVNTYFSVLASPISQSDVYFRALREELETALEEGVILVERVQVWIP
jgi:hypothetical protein